MKKIITLIACIFIFISSASAATMPVPALAGGGKYEQPAGYVGGNTDNLFIYASGTTLYWDSYALLGGSATVNTLPYSVSDVCADTDYIYIVFYNGMTYRVPNELGLQSWSALNVTYLGDYSSESDAGYVSPEIDVDSEGNIYVSSPQDYKITKIDGELLTSIIWQSGIPVFNGYQLALFCGNNHFWYGANNHISDDDQGTIYSCDSAGNGVSEFFYTTSSLASSCGGISELDNGNLVVLYSSVVPYGEYLKEYYPNGTVVGSIATVSIPEDQLEGQVGDIFVTQNGVCVFFDHYHDAINTYSTVSGSGGYFVSTASDPEVEEEGSMGELINSNASISWDLSIYNTGDTATISFNVENFDYDTYDYKVEVHDTVSLKQSYSIADVVNKSVSYPFPATATTSTYLAQFIAIDSSTGVRDVLAMDTASFDNDEDYSIDFDSGTYHIGDTMSIYYSVPTNSSIYLRGTDSSSKTVYSKTWSVSGNSHLSLTVPDNTVESYTAYALYDGYTLDYDVAEVLQSESEVTVYGVVYDAQTGATIENAHILINGSGPYSNEIGRYSYIIEAGAYPLVVSKTGYNTQSYSSVSFLTDTNRHFYMTPVSGISTSSTATLYGVVRDYETGAALEGAMLTVTNSTGFTKTRFSSSTGYFEVTGLLNNSSYSVYSSLDGYDNYYNASVTVTGLTWLEFSMVDEDYSLGTGTDGSSTTTTERPGRAGAEQTLVDLEGIVPSLVTIIVFVVFMAVMKKA